VELLVAPLDVLDELEDEHAAAVRVSSKTAVAPAAGFAKDRFIPAPLLFVFGFRSATGNLAETYGSIVRRPCHRCQYCRLMIYNRV
jgi:hypothetical protein